jgi:hypothetical protein
MYKNFMQDIATFLITNYSICPRIGIWQTIDNFTLRLECNNSLGQVTSLQLGNPVVELPSFSLWTGISYSFSCVDDGTFTLL